MATNTAAQCSPVITKLVSVNPVWQDVAERTRVHIKLHVETIGMNFWRVRNSEYWLETNAFLT